MPPVHQSHSVRHKIPVCRPSQRRFLLLQLYLQYNPDGNPVVILCNADPATPTTVQYSTVTKQFLFSRPLSSQQARMKWTRTTIERSPVIGPDHGTLEMAGLEAVVVGSLGLRSLSSTVSWLFRLFPFLLLSRFSLLASRLVVYTFPLRFYGGIDVGGTGWTVLRFPPHFPE